MRRAAVAAVVMAVLAGAVAWTLAAHPSPAAGPVATLAVLTGTTQLTRAGTSVAAVGKSGDQLGPGDRVATGPGTRARLIFADGEETRLDSGTIVVLDGPEHRGGLHVLAGRTWDRRLGPRGVPDPADPWTILNRALDLLPPDESPATIGTGMLLPGEESAAQQAVSLPPQPSPPDLVFTAGWGPGSLDLAVLDPDGRMTGRSSGAATPLTLTVAHARAGQWQYRVRDLDPTGGPSTWFVLVSVSTRSTAESSAILAANRQNGPPGRVWSRFPSGIPCVLYSPFVQPGPLNPPLL